MVYRTGYKTCACVIELRFTAGTTGIISLDLVFDREKTITASRQYACPNHHCITPIRVSKSSLHHADTRVQNITTSRRYACPNHHYITPIRVSKTLLHHADTRVQIITTSRRYACPNHYYITPIRVSKSSLHHADTATEGYRRAHTF